MAEEASGDFELSGAAEPGSVRADRLSELAGVYKRTPRVLRGWILDGKRKGIACPLDSPELMPDWWARVKTWSCPDEILRAAAESIARKKSLNETTQSPGGGAPPPVTTGHAMSPVDVSGFTLEEGEEVRQARQLVAVAWKAVEEAYARPTSASVDVVLKRHAAAMKALDIVERADRVRQKQRGELLPRVAVQRDIDAACVFLLQLRDSMPRQVLELIPDLPPEFRGKVEAAIVKVRAKEDAIFQQLPSLRDADHVSELLAA